MTLKQFNINQAFSDVFGVYARIPAFPTAQQPAAPNSTLPSFPDAQGDTSENPYNFLHVSATGEVVWDRITVEYDNDGVLTEYHFPHETVAEPSCDKNIVTTQLAGRDGTVKEYLSRGDWEVHLRGFLINYEEDIYPQEAYKELARVFASNKPMRIKSKVLNDLGIFDVVAKPIKFPPMEGFANCQPFELTLLSDETIELELTDV